MVWEHEVPIEVEYNQDKPFFHSWQGDVSYLRVTMAALGIIVATT